MADVRWYPDGRSGRAAYEAGHVPGAVYVDVDSDLSGPPSGTGGRHPLPPPREFARALSSLGIGDGDTVIGYDDAGGAVAARLVWMLRITGHDSALLDGGLAAWPGALATGPVSRPPASFTAVPWPEERLAGMDEVARVAGSGGTVVDARAAERYRGEPHPLDPRPGHIPGARNLPHTGNLDPGSGGFLRPDRLRERFAAVGVGDTDVVIAYCGSGVTACHDLLALELAGLPPGRLFPGSWSAWASDPDRPAALGDRP